jgi:hypothetical protein
MSDTQTIPLAGTKGGAVGAVDLPEGLFVRVARDGSLRIGTCSHCVLREPGRPERAWDAQGDAELDFPRDVLLALLERLGVRATVVEEYVCP